MATVDVGVSSELSPERAWELASDLRRFDEWLTIFGGWKSDVPAVIDVDTQVASLIKVKGFRNVIHWRVTRYDEPKEIELVGTGRGGVTHHADDAGRAPCRRRRSEGSHFRVLAELSGGLLNTPIGGVVARSFRGDVRRSVANLAALR